MLDPVPPGAVGALAGWLAVRADAWWEMAGYPDPYTLVVVSGDDGPLAAAVLEAAPKCAPALRYVVVNPDVAGRTEPPPRLVELVALEDPVFLYPARRKVEADEYADEDDDLDDLVESPPARGIGPLATFLTDVPALGDGEGALIAVGVLSRLPYDLYERVDDGGWNEIRVAADGDELRELALPAADEAVGPSEAGTTGPRWARQIGAADWLRRVIPSANAADLAVVDDWDALDLDQLTPVREPADSSPVSVDGTPYAAVTWRLGDRARRY